VAAVDKSLGHVQAGGSHSNTDNIAWVAVAQLVGTRSATQCLSYWGKMRGKTMEEKGIWADGAYPPSPGEKVRDGGESGEGGHLAGSHGRWKRPWLQTAHMTI
jgi:hypothetical protein